MRVPVHVVEERREKLARLLDRHAYLPVQEVCRRLGVSEATARRDLAALEKERKIIRTFGGALSEFNQRFTSFTERRGRSADGKRWIAKRAVELVCPGMLVYMDSGTTVYAVAERMTGSSLTGIEVVTNNLPVAESLSRLEDVKVFLLGGEFLSRQSVLLGELAVRGLGEFRFDLSFLGAEGMDGEGVWNSTEAIVGLQREVMKRSADVAFCIDGEKLGRRAPEHLAGWGEVPKLLTDAGAGDIREAGIGLEPGRLVCRSGN